MSLTRIGSIGINTGIKFSGLTTITTLNTSIDTLSIGGPVSIAGTLTYEDVTNIDAVGLITARNGIVVGSGITLSKDGDVFFTGIATGNGSGLTAINASNIGSGTVPTARLGSGTASSSTFLRGDSTFQTVVTDLVSDTSPQLGGNLDVNTKNIVFGDSGGATDDRLTFGASTDLSIYHDGSHSRIDETGTGNLMIQSDNAVFIKKGTSENIAIFNADGAVELYHNNVKKLETSSSGVTISGDNSTGSYIKGVARFTPNDSTTVKVIWDEGGFSSAGAFQVKDGVAFTAGDSSDLKIFHDGSNSYVRETGTGSLFVEGNSNIYIGKASGGAENGIVYNVDGSVDLYYNNLRKFRTVSDGVEVNAAEGADAVLALIADEGDDNADYWRFLGGTAGQLDIASYSTGSWVNHLSIKPDGEVTKPNNPAASVYTNTSEQGGHGNEVSQGFIKNGGETFDISNDHGYVSNLGRFTCPVDGRYRVSFFSNISVDGLTGDAFNIQVMKNGGTVHLHYDMKTATSWQYMTISDLISCSANDYLQIYLKAGNGSSQGTIGVDGSSAQWNSTMYELVA